MKFISSLSLARARVCVCVDIIEEKSKIIILHLAESDRKMSGLISSKNIIMMESLYKFSHYLNQTSFSDEHVHRRTLHLLFH